jgi:serine/threonine protein kinase
MIEGKHKYEPLLVDIWSSGVVLFAMIAGYLPFCDPDISTLYKKILIGSFKFPAWISEDAKDLISKMLVVNPSKRIQISEIF